MKCGRLKLQERTRSGCCRPGTPVGQKPRRYCQKRLVDPDHDEDPRWIDVLERFHCNELHNEINNTRDTTTTPEEENLFLSVQNLKFQGEDEQRKRPRTSFKYTRTTDNNKHRMFVKQPVPALEPEDDTSSQLTCYYYDDYAKYLSNTDPSRPSSGKSSIFLQGSSTKFKENKAVQVDFSNSSDTWKARKVIFKPKVRKPVESETKQKLFEEMIADLPETTPDDTKISFQNAGKRKSLTISRTQSPETFQVIRVDVVCNYSSSPPPPLAAAEDKAPAEAATIEITDRNTDTVHPKKSHFTNKYLLTNTIKTLDENVSGGAKVTLLCKTFRLTDRTKMLSNKKSSNVTSFNCVGT